ncbi:hypothetical protein BpHYR1_046923 [Brachionus plicatilis]|uniref:Uncharacterized protein n=1 Tax=Brachionus plicatilis TaxID=10195 RepID=A0A3M7SLX4_BRAPC|nr:hypothetical protein BpHYR1_046923 [Brachionus plicatilis]
MDHHLPQLRNKSFDLRLDLLELQTLEERRTRAPSNFTVPTRFTSFAVQCKSIFKVKSKDLTLKRL